MVETMLKLHRDLPKAKTPQAADGLQLAAGGSWTRERHFPYF
jgi:hypothetical protein